MTTARSPKGLSLGARIFLVTALAVALAVGAAVALTYFLGEKVAQESVERSLRRSSSVQSAIMERDLERLRLMAESLARDPVFVSYVAEATGGGLGDELEVDRASLRDQLFEQRDKLGNNGFDFAILLDSWGVVLARTNRPDAFGEDLSAVPLIGQVTENPSPEGAADYWVERDGLYQVAAVSLIQGFEVYGTLVLGFAVDGALANELRQVTGTDLSFLLRSEGRLILVASTFDASHSDELLGVLQDRSGMVTRVLDEGTSVPQVDLELLSSRYRAYLAPLKDLDDTAVAAILGVSSLDEQLSGYRQIQRGLLLAGLGALLTALALSYGLSRRTLKPLRDLTAAAENAAKGDYDTSISIGRGDEVGRLSEAFDSLLSDLREKKELEVYVSDLSRHLPEPSRKGTAKPASAQDMALVALEMRRYAHPRTAKDPTEAMDRLSQDLRRITSVTFSHQGKVEAAAGHRVLLRFEGDQGALRALAAAGELHKLLGTPENAFDQAEPPVFAITVGRAATGSAVWGDQPEAAVLGLPVQQLESLLREAAPGDLLVSRQAQRELVGQLSELGVELSNRPSLLTPQPIFALDPEDASKITMPGARTSVLQSVAPSKKEMTLSAIGPGSTLGERFEILSVLGAGGMGVVYKARDRELDDLVALKTLRADFWGDSQFLDRLKDELKLARRITHPNVLRTYDFGQVDQVPFISMEYVRGMTVRFLLEQTERLPFSAALRLGRQLCEGLAAAHAVGVLHRDIKPENLIIDPAGNLKLMDFGIARPLDRLQEGQTVAGSIVGTPHYLAPEQLKGKPVDARADIYACGVVFFEIFTGGLPFGGSSPLEIITAHLREPPLAPSEVWPEIPPSLERLILHCLEKEPEDRPAAMEDVLRQLEAQRA